MKFDRKVAIGIHPTKGLQLDKNGTLEPDPNKVLDRVIHELKERKHVAGVHKYSLWIPGVSDDVEMVVPLSMITKAQQAGYVAYLNLAKYGKPKLVLSDPATKPKRATKIEKIA